MLGSGSLLSKFEKFLSSTIKFSFRTPLTLSIYCFSASDLFTNQLCLGLFKIPYFCFAERLIAGTDLLYSSYPIKLSNHFLSMSLLGTLVANPSVII